MQFCLFPKRMFIVKRPVVWICLNNPVLLMNFVDETMILFFLYQIFILMWKVDVVNWLTLFYEYLKKAMVLLVIWICNVHRWYGSPCIMGFVDEKMIWFTLYYEFCWSKDDLVHPVLWVLLMKRWSGSLCIMGFVDEKVIWFTLYYGFSWRKGYLVHPVLWVFLTKRLSGSPCILSFIDEKVIWFTLYYGFCWWKGYLVHPVLWVL